MRGTRTETMVPTPSVERMRIVPPCSSVSDREMARPSPEPPVLFENWFWTCSNGRPILCIADLGMPMPVSSMVTVTAFDSRRALTRIRPPSFVNFTALDSRFRSTCFIARRSASMLSPGSMSRSIGIFFPSAGIEVSRTASSTSGARSMLSRSISSWPASIFDMSRMSLITPSRCWPLPLMSRAYSSYFGEPSGPNSPFSRISEKPMIAFSGVRSSCDMLARNSDLVRLAASARSFSA